MGNDASPDPDRDARAGRKVGPFRLEDEIGGGGMGVVYRAEGPGGERVALKVVRGPRPGEELLERFEREARIRIEHPNIVRVLDAGVDPDEGAPYIAFELLEGETLEERLRRGPLRPAEAVDLGRQVCAGLAAAHAAGVIHRDLKPSNLYCCANGVVKILDFGVALAAARETRLTSEGSVIGTPAYMAPEQVRGQRVIDARADVWAVGAVLYEALSGRPPFVRETPLAVMLAVLMDQPEPLWARALGVPTALAAVVERALAKGLDLRWGSAEELSAALAGVDLRGPSSAATARPPADAVELAETLIAPASASAEAPPALIPHGERRIVAVLLAEGVRDLGGLGAAIQKHGGALLPLVGHRAIGLFGAEAWEGDELARAAAAAVGARGAAERMAVASGRAGASGAGISGEALRAAEAGCAAGLGGVAADAASARSLEEEFAAEERGPGLWEITGRRSAESRRSRPSGREAPLLGREAELLQLRAGVERAIEEQRAVVLLVTGPPGIGKTRLRRAIEGELPGLCGEGRAPAVITARAEPLGQKTALSLVRAALRGYAELDEAEAEAGAGAGAVAMSTLGARQEALLELAGGAIDDPAAARACAEALGELLGVPMPETPALLAARADPQLMVDRVRLGLLDLFEGLAGRGPVALVLEDLQWADRASLSLLGDILDRLADAPLVVLATARPEFLEAQPDLFAERDVVRVEPRGLSARDVAALARWIAGRALPEPLGRAIAERTAGHPLFVEQIVLELRDRGLVDGDVAELPITPTVEAAVQSRLDHLPPAEKDACKRAAVLSRPFTAEELEAMGVAGATAVLGSLGRRDIVAARARTGGARGRVFQFRSALVAEVAYGMLAEDARRDLHRRAARTLLGQEGAGDEEVATHFERGGAPAEAADRYAAAALAAAPRGDAATVLRCAGKALELGAPPEMRFALHMARADALRFLGRRDELARELSLSRSFAASDADLARVLTDLATYQTRSGKAAEAVETAREAVAAAERAGDAEVITVARATAMGALIYDGRLPQARVALGEALREADAATPRARAILAGWRAHLAAALGDHGERREAFEEAIALYREAGDVRRVASAEVNLADVYNRLGAYAEAEAALRQALEGCRRLKNQISEGYALVNLGYAVARQGRFEEALALLEEALEIATGAREVRLSLWARYYHARTRLAGASPEEGVAEAEAVAAEAERLGDGAALVGARTVIARARLSLGDPAGALAASAQALAKLDELGGIEEGEAELFVTHAAALAAAGRAEEAAAIRARGRARVEEIAGRIRDAHWRSRFLAVAVNRELVGEG